VAFGLVAVMVAAALPVAALVIAARSSTSTVRGRTFAGAEATAQAVAGLAAQAYANVHSGIGRTGTSPTLVESLTSGDRSATAALLQRYVASYRLRDIVVYDSHDHLVASAVGADRLAPIPQAPSGRIRGLTEGPVEVKGESTSRELSVPVVSTTGTLLGYVEADADLESLIDNPATLRFGKTGVSLVVGTDGRIITGGDLPEIGTILSAVNTRVARAHRPGTLITSGTADQGQVVEGYAPVTGQPFGVLTQQSTGEAFASLSTLLDRLRLLELAFGLIGVASAIAVTGAISRRSNRIMNQATALIETQALFRSVFEGGPIGAAVVSLERRWVEPNPALCRLLGYSAEVLATKSIYEVTHPDDISASRDLTQQVIDRISSSDSVEQRYLDAAGQTLWARVTVSVVRDSDDTPRYFVFQIEDITARHEASEVLLESEERYRLLVEGVEDYAIMTLDSEGIVTTWNRAAERLKGYSAAEIVGQSHARFYTAEQLEARRPSVLLDRARLQGHSSDEDWRVRKDGSQFWANVNITLLRTHDGHVRGFSKITRNLSERKEAEDEIRRSAAELARSNTDLEQFAYIASHDLREPLRHISAFSRKFADRYSDIVDDRGRQYLGYVLDGSTRLQQLIDGLLEFSRVGRGQPPLVSVDLDDLVASAIRGVSVMAKEANAVITTSSLPAVQGDIDLLYRLFVNLLSNGIKFARPDRLPCIHVSTRPGTDGFVEVMVSDNGIGIEPQYRERAFEIFEQLNGHTYPGAGIGLSVARRILEAHGGCIALSDSPEGGTLVTLAFATRVDDHATSAQW
jgi:PAS domain S-box-containing protein